MAGVGAVKEGAQVAGWRDLLRRDLGPIEQVEHVCGVTAAWLCVIWTAQYADPSQFGGPLEATLVYFGCGLIPVGILQFGMFTQMWKNDKSEQSLDKLARRCDKEHGDLARRCDRLEAELKEVKKMCMAGIVENGRLRDENKSLRELAGANGWNWNGG